MYIYVNTVVQNVTLQLCLWHDIYNIDFKIKYKLYKATTPGDCDNVWEYIPLIQNISNQVLVSVLSTNNIKDKTVLYDHIFKRYKIVILLQASHRLRSWLMYCDASQKVVGSFPDEFIGIFDGPYPYGLTMPHTLTEMSTIGISRG